MDRLAGRPIFSLGERVFSWEDVVLSAYLTGVVAVLEQQIKRAIAAEEQIGLTDEDVEESANAWRYERELISADDLEAWLGARALTLDEWSAYIRRTASAKRASGRTAKRKVPGGADVLFAEAMCSGAVTEVIDWLAGRAAVFDRMRPARPPARSAVRSSVARLPASVRKRGLKRAEDIAVMDLVYRRFVKSLAGDVLRREVDGHALEWTRLDAQTLRFAAEGPAREAALLIRDDGLPITKVATLARTTVAERSDVLEDVADPLRRRLVSAQPGELVGPLRDEDGFTVMLVTDRVVPSVQDREIRARARDRVERRVVGAEIEKRIRWHERF